MLVGLPLDAVESKEALVVVYEDDHKERPVVLKCDRVALEPDGAERVGLVLLVSLWAWRDSSLGRLLRSLPSTAKPRACSVQRSIVCDKRSNSKRGDEPTKLDSDWLAVMPQCPFTVLRRIYSFSAGLFL